MMSRLFLPALLLLVALSSGCGGNDFQSALHPASSEARAIAWLWWVMVIVYGAVFVITLALAAVAVLRRKAPEGETAEAPGGSHKFVVVAGIVIPSIILLGMLVYSLKASSAMRMPETDFVIRITAHQFWWDVRYPDQEIASANEIRIPVGVPVRLELTSADVIHSFWVPNLHGKIDMFPDHWTRFWLQAERTGIFRGACAELCGDQHALMGMDVIVMEPGEFEAWVAERRAPAAAAEPARGHTLFFSAGCAACHAIEGTEAVSDLGPDLTHLSDRLNLAAAFLPNNPENLARWIADPQGLKPGNRMPPTHLEEADLQALVEYLLTPR
jgi:cytochrome c oxidase subunit II